MRASNFCLIVAATALVAGCGSPSNQIAIAGPQTVVTGAPVQLYANLPNGAAVDAKWTITGGDPVTGPGTITQQGLYTPPSYLTQSSSNVQVSAVYSISKPTQASATIALVPGLSVIDPQIATLGAGGSLQVTVRIAQTNGADSVKVNWTLASDPAGASPVGSSYGTLTSAPCTVGLLNINLTFCSVSYVAPSTLPVSTGGSVYIVGVLANAGNSSKQTYVLFSTAGINSSPSINQKQQTLPIALGTSGINVNAACSTGTLSALLEGSDSQQYILSNNHVIANQDKASIGDPIVHPGLADTNCDPSKGISVATLAYFVPLSSTATNVDTGVAISAGPTYVNPSGAILQYGALGAGGLLGAAPPASDPEAITAGNANLKVVKSGRTTGLTCAVIDAIGVDAEIPYDDPTTGQPYTKHFTDQLSIAGPFMDGGDSGSLIVDQATAQPVGLLFAGSDLGTEQQTFANPIGDVLTALQAQTGSKNISFSFVGGAHHAISCLDYSSDTVTTPDQTIEPTAQSLAEKANLAAAALVSPQKGILGTAVGKSLDSPGDPAVLVYVDRTRSGVQVPQTIQGVRTVVVATDAAKVSAHAVPAATAPDRGIHLPESVLTAAMAVKKQNVNQIMSDPAIFAVGVSQSYDNPSEAVLNVYVDRTMTPKATPPTVGGVRVRYITTSRARPMR